MLTLIAQLVLAGVFGLAAVTKLADPAGSRAALADFGVPRPAVGPVASALPVLEGVVAALLVWPSGAAWGAFGALLLLAIFCAAIAINLARGRRPECHCFGQVHSAPVGWRTLARNAVLSMGALLVAFPEVLGAEPGGAIAASGMAAVGAASWSAVAVGLFIVQTWVIYHLLRQQGRLVLRLDEVETALRENGLSLVPPAVAGLPVGSPAPSFALHTPSGESVSLKDLFGTGAPVLLLFSDPGCRPCQELLPEARRWERTHTGTLTIALITRQSADGGGERPTEYGLARVLIQRDREVAQAYGAEGTPSAVLIAQDGTVMSALAMGSSAIRDLVARAAGERAPPASSHRPLRPATPHGSPNSDGLMPVTPDRGTAVPPFALPDLDGTMVHAADLRGRSHVLVFWNPNCGFCTRMLPDLIAAEASHEPRPTLILISAGTVESNRALGLQAPILLDPSFSVGAALGVTGTPSAVLLDADGALASSVAVGASHVLTLVMQTEPVGLAFADGR